MNWDDPIGQSFQLDEKARYVIGVVEDFYYDDFYTPIEPVLFTITDSKNFQSIVFMVTPLFWSFCKS